MTGKGGTGKASQALQHVFSRNKDSSLPLGSSNPQSVVTFVIGQTLIVPAAP